VAALIDLGERLDIEPGAVGAAQVRERYGLTREEFSRVAGASVRSLATYEQGKSPPGRAVQTRLVELARLHSALAGVMKAGAINAWITTPSAGFGGLKPLEVIERGQIDRVWRAVYELSLGTAT
jgi:transcriptional regulator with XRE-family HTH domain